MYVFSYLLSFFILYSFLKTAIESSIWWQFGFLSLWKHFNTWSSFAGLLLCCTKLSVKLLSELRCKAIISVQCNVKNFCYRLLHLAKQYYRMKIVWVILCQYYQGLIHILFSTNLSKTYFAILSSIQFNGVVSALNNCTRLSNLVAWCKPWSRTKK